MSEPALTTDASNHLVTLASGALAAASAVSAVGCGGGGSSGGGGGGVVAPADAPTQPVAPAVTTQEEAGRFLHQASFGPTQEEINEVMSGGYDAWLYRNYGEERSTHLPQLDSVSTSDDRIAAWWNNVVNGRDQLRQRMAFALSQIFVVSEADLSGSARAFGLASYYDMLSEHALGSYRALLEAVTLHPMMGEYLSMVRNEKPNEAKNIRPDENYAREVMQLFTIGLVVLNEDGSVRGGGNGTPTYDQEVIEGFAHVFTGWNYANSPSWNGSHRDYINPMEPNEDYHDTGAKNLLSGTTLPAGRTAREDLKDALDLLANHPNVPPFICKQLIKRLVTSNPTPGYVSRVAQVFKSDERGVRGNLGAVARAILLDPEARTGHQTVNNFGKLKEPLVRIANIWRAFDARAANGRYFFSSPERELGQAPLRAPSVFNFFSPSFQQPGELADAGIVSPEFQILTESNLVGTTNRLNTITLSDYEGAPNRRLEAVLIQIGRERALAHQPGNLVAHLNRLMMSGRMTTTMRNALIELLDDTPFGDDGTERVIEAIFIIATSPEFAIQA